MFAFPQKFPSGQTTKIHIFTSSISEFDKDTNVESRNRYFGLQLFGNSLLVLGLFSTGLACISGSVMFTFDYPIEAIQADGARRSHQRVIERLQY